MILKKNLLNLDILNNIKNIINIADIIIFMLDAKTGIIPFDHSCADVLRKLIASDYFIK